MFKTALKYSAFLIGGYLVVAYATGFATAFNSGSSGAVNLVKAFQGR